MTAPTSTTVYKVREDVAAGRDASHIYTLFERKVTVSKEKGTPYTRAVVRHLFPKLTSLQLSFRMLLPVHTSNFHRIC